MWKLPNSKNDQLRLAYARTYKAPDANALPPRRYLSDNNSATNPDSVGNPHLRPELSSGIDGAFEHFLPDGGTLSVSVYARRIKDVTLTQTTNIDDRWVSMASNGGRANSHGIELEAKFPLKLWFKAAPAIDFHSNAAFNWSTLNSVPGPDNRLNAQTPVSANVGIDYQPGQTQLTYGANLTFQRGGPVRISQAQRNTGASKRVLDFYGLWKLDSKLSCRFSLSNLLRQDNVSTKTYATQDSVLYERTVAPTSVTMRVMLESKF